MQSYIAGENDKDTACSEIERLWKEIEGAQ